jgi:hypothetical protein
MREWTVRPTTPMSRPRTGRRMSNRADRVGSVEGTDPAQTRRTANKLYPSMNRFGSFRKSRVTVTCSRVSNPTSAIGVSSKL